MLHERFTRIHAQVFGCICMRMCIYWTCVKLRRADKTAGPVGATTY